MDAHRRRPPPRISVAPMIDVSDRHFRMMIRCVSPLPTVYTEMTWDRAILYNAPGEPEHLLNKNEPRVTVDSIIGFSEAEQPLVMQLGGAEPANLARSAKYCVEHGYEEINLNCGCPAQVRGRSKNIYGARLMFEPERVAACCAAMIDAVGGRADVTVKCRLGVDSKDSWEELTHFIRTVSASGVRHFIVHARKAILGLNTIQNRQVPPLRHEWVARLVVDFPDLKFTLNGGVGSVDEVVQILHDTPGLHGVMLGRRSNADPYLYAKCGVLFSGEAGRSRREAIEAYAAYTQTAQTSNWESHPAQRLARSLLTPLTGLLHNTPFGPQWRRHLTALMDNRDLMLTTPVSEVIMQALSTLPAAVLDERPSLKIERLALSQRGDGGWVRVEGPRAISVPGRASGGDSKDATEEPTGGWREAGKDADGASTAVEVAFAATDGEAMCPGAAKAAAGAPYKRSGRGQDEMEAVLEAEAHVEDQTAMHVRMAVALAVAVVAAGALVVAAAARRTRG